VECEPAGIVRRPCRGRVGGCTRTFTCRLRCGDYRLCGHWLGWCRLRLRLLQRCYFSLQRIYPVEQLLNYFVLVCLSKDGRDYRKQRQH
jgi:hypothetical protein